MDILFYGPCYINTLHTNIKLGTFRFSTICVLTVDNVTLNGMFVNWENLNVTPTKKPLIEGSIDTIQRQVEKYLCRQ